MTSIFPRPHPMPTTAIVLAGGLGTRLRGVVSDRPKVLAPVAGKPFLGYLLAYLATQGIERVILSIGYLGGQVRNFAADGEPWGLEIDYAKERTPLGTGGALRHASTGLNEPFFALNGDTLFMVNLRALWLGHRAQQVWGTIALRAIPKGAPDWQERGCVILEEGRTEFGQIESDQGQTAKIVAFDEKPGSVPRGGDEDTIFINGGVYALEPRALASLPEGQSSSIEHQVFPQLAAQGHLGGYIQPAYFADIGTPESLTAFEKDVRTWTSNNLWLQN